jgi:hypothetical protein
VAKVKKKVVKKIIAASKSNTKSKAKTLAKIIEPKRSADIPVTKGQFDEFRAEIQYSITSHNLELKAFRKETESKFNQLDAKFEAKFNELDAKFEAKFNQLEARIDQLEIKIEARFTSIEAVLHKILLTIEEQNARNKYVLDGYAQLYDRIEEHKTAVDKKLSDFERQLMLSK